MSGEGQSCTRSAGKFYIPELDTLRFFAFLGVFIWHAPPTGFAFYKAHGLVGSLGIAGCFGVDLFFALSAFLITELLLRERTMMGKIDVGSFYLRRLLRIWPLYFFCLALWFCESRFLGWFTFKPSYLAAMSLFMGNFAIFFWGEAGAPVYIWTVSMEEQFYLLWPLVLRKGSKRTIVITGVILVAVACATRLALCIRGTSPSLIWYNTLTRLDPIAGGALLATLPKNTFTNLGSLTRSGFALAGLALWLFAAHYCDLLSPTASTVHIMMGYPAVALGSCAFLAATLQARPSGFARLVFNRLSVYLGKISYGLYVYHAFVFMFVKAFMMRVVLFWLLRGAWPLWLGWPIYLALSFGATVLIAACSYRFLEAPFLKLKSKFAYVASRPA